MFPPHQCLEIYKGMIELVGIFVENQLTLHVWVYI